MLSQIDLGMSDASFVIGKTPNEATHFKYNYYPKNANSYVIVEYVTKYSVVGAGNDGATSIVKINGSQVGDTYQRWSDSQGGGTRSGVLFPLYGRYTNSGNNSLTALPIQVITYNLTDTDDITIYTDGSTWLKITEIGR